MNLRAFLLKKHRIFHRCLYQANATLSVRTLAETIGYCPDFYHWQANVAEDTIVAHQNCVLWAFFVLTGVQILSVLENTHFSSTKSN